MRRQGAGTATCFCHRSLQVVQNLPLTVLDAVRTIREELRDSMQESDHQQVDRPGGELSKVVSKRKSGKP